MKILVESPESRTLLSVTPAATLSAAASLISADGAAVTAAPDELGASNATKDEAISAALAGVDMRTNDKIFKALKADSVKAEKGVFQSRHRAEQNRRRWLRSLSLPRMHCCSSRASRIWPR